MCEVCSKLAIKTPERRHLCRVFINFEQISHIVLVFPLLTLNKQMPGRVLLFNYFYLAIEFKQRKFFTCDFSKSFCKTETFYHSSSSKNSVAETLAKVKGNIINFEILKIASGFSRGHKRLQPHFLLANNSIEGLLTRIENFVEP